MSEANPVGPVPPPGSDAALALGCRCPVLDNAHGLGWATGKLWWVNGDCPLHGKMARQPAITLEERPDA